MRVVWCGAVCVWVVCFDLCILDCSLLFAVLFAGWFNSVAFGILIVCLRDLLCCCLFVYWLVVWFGMSCCCLFLVFLGCLCCGLVLRMWLIVQ